METTKAGSARRSRARPWLAALLACAALAIHALWFRCESDDAYISFRYARNLLAGHGLVFNPGEAVEGYSNLLWVLLCSAGMAAGLPALLWARLMGLAAAAGTLLLLPGSAARLRAPGSPPQPAAAWLLAACGPWACWSLGGLETALFGLLLVLAWRAALERRPLAAGAWGVPLLLARPEGPGLALALAVWAGLPGGRGGGAVSGHGAAAQASGAAVALANAAAARRWSGIAVVLAATALHLLWRHSTYGDWLPNTYYAKTGDLAGQLRTGLPYAGRFLLAFALPSAAVLGWRAARGGEAARAAWHALDLRLTILLLGGWTAYAAAIGGDMLGMYRFFAPVLPLFAAACAALLAAGRTRARWPLVALLCLLLLPASLAGKERRIVTAHLSQANLGGWKLAAEGLAAQLPAGTTIALGPVGYIPYRTGFVTYDLLGLTDRHIARRKMRFQQGYAGHEKHDGAHILGRRPDYLLLGNVDVTQQPRRSPMRPFARELDIFQHPIFHAEYVPVFLPLPGGKYLNCFVRRDLAPAQ